MIFTIKECPIGNPNFPIVEPIGDEVKGGKISCVSIRPFREKDEISPLVVTPKGISENLKEKVSIYNDFGKWDSGESKEELELLLVCVPTSQFTITVTFDIELNTLTIILDGEDGKTTYWDGSLKDISNSIDRQNIQVRINPKMDKSNNYAKDSLFTKSFTHSLTLNSVTVHSDKKRNTYDVKYLVALFTDIVREQCTYVATNGNEDKELLEILDTLAIDNDLLLIVDAPSLIEIKRGHFNHINATHIKIYNDVNLSMEWGRLALVRDNLTKHSPTLQVNAYRIMGIRQPINADGLNIEKRIYKLSELEYMKENNIIYVSKRFNTFFFQNTDKFNENIELYIKRSVKAIAEKHQGNRFNVAKIEATREVNSFIGACDYGGFFEGIIKPKYSVVDNRGILDITLSLD